MRVRVNKDERVLLYKHGDYVRVLRPGKYILLPFRGYTKAWFNVNSAFEPLKNLNLYLEDKALVEEVQVRILVGQIVWARECSADVKRVRLIT